jgi:hypothetical protein
MGSISVNYDETDVAKLLDSIIKHPNKEEFVNLLTPMLCKSSNAVNLFFKLAIGNKLPEVFPTGTICKISIKNVVYNDIERQKLQEQYGDTDGKMIVTIKQFRGFDEWSPYTIEFKKPNGDLDTTYVAVEYLEVIEEF